MSKQSKVFLAILGLFSVLACSFHSLNASAIDLTQDVDYKEVTNGQLYYRLYNGTSWGSFYNGGTYSMGASERVTALQYRNTNNSLPADTKQGDFFTLGMWVQFDGTGSHWNTSGYYYITETTDGVSCPILDIDANTIQNFNDSNGNTSQRHLLFITCKITSASPSSIGMNLGLRSVAAGMRFNPVTFSHWRKSSNTLVDEMTAVKNAVNNMSSAIQNKLDTTNNKLDTLNISVNDLKAAQEQANDDANDRYQDEKDTINENAQQGQEQSETLGGINLSILNPLNSWKNYFSNGCSVNIPIIAGWIHAPSSTYTSWWCTNSTLSGIKSVLSGVISIVGVMIVFGFAFKWLRTNNGED